MVEMVAPVSVPQPPGNAVVRSTMKLAGEPVSTWKSIRNWPAAGIAVCVMRKVTGVTFVLAVTRNGGP